MTLSHNFQEKSAAHIAGLMADLQSLPWGSSFLETLRRSEYPVEPMPEDIAREFPNSPALLALDPLHTIFLTNEATADDLCHEIRHVEQYLTLPDELIKASDMKHRFMVHAFMEADAYAHQTAMLIQLMATDPQKLTDEMEIYDLYNDPKSEVLMEPVRVALYTSLNRNPKSIVEDYNANPESLYQFMSFVFSWSFHEIVPKQYEQRHLDAIHTTMLLAEKGTLAASRSQPFEVTTAEDIDFFMNCIRDFGGTIYNYEVSYLIDKDGMGPAPLEHIAQIITTEVIAELTRMNKQISLYRPAAAEIKAEL